MNIPTHIDDILAHKNDPALEDQGHVVAAANSTAIVSIANPHVTRQVMRALAAIGCQVVNHPPNSVEFNEQLFQDANMLVMDVDHSESRRAVDAINSTGRDIAILALTRDLHCPYLRDLVVSGSLDHLVARHAVSASQEVVDDSELITTCHKILSGDIFGIEKYISAPGAQVRRQYLWSTTQRDQSLIDLGNFLNDIGVRRSQAPQIVTVADELIMNALFNAPCDPNGQSRHRNRDRRLGLNLDPRTDRVELAFACDGTRIALSVADRFGHLDRDTIVRYLDPHFRGKSSSVDFSAGGAGVGLSLVLNSVTQLVFNIQPGERTEVICIFYDRGLGQFRPSGRSFNIFIHQHD